MEYYATICRLCESPDQTGDSWVELFSPMNDQVLPMIRACANIVLCENDELPQRICGSCYQNVKLSYNFKMQCEVTDAKLRHEIALRAKNGEGSNLSVPPFLVDRKGTNVDETLAVDKVFVKTEVEEGEVKGQTMLAGESDDKLCLSKTDGELEIDLDWNPYKDEPSDSEDSDDNSEDVVQGEDAKLRPEIASLAKNSEDSRLAVSPFLVDRKDMRVDETMTVDKVFIKTEVEEDEDEGQVMVAGESYDGLELKIEVDCNTYKNEPNDSESEDGLDGDEKRTPKPKKTQTMGVKATQQSHICKTCGKNFTSRKNLNSHYQNLHGPKPYKCSQCSKCYIKKSHLQSHEAAKHAGIRHFECPQCDKKYASRPGLKGHMEDAHSDDLPYVCDKCGKKYATANKLGYHYIVHNETRDVICDICKKGFKNKTGLYHHMAHCHLKKGRNRRTGVQQESCEKISDRINTDESKNECHICFKRFDSERPLRRHIKVHTSTRPHMCQYCQKTFRFNYLVNQHIRRVHMNEKPYECKFCPGAFPTLWRLQRHAKSHVGRIDSSKQEQEIPLAAPHQQMDMLDNMS